MVRLQDQDHAFAFHLRVALDLGNHEKLGLDLREDLPPKVNVRQFAAAELQGELNLVSFFKELAGMIDFDLKIVIPDFDSLHLQFFKLTGARRGAALVGFLLLLISPLAVVHDFTHGRAGVGGHFNQVKSQFAGAALGFCGAGRA